MAKATYAVIGDPIAHSLSPLIHNTLYQTYRLDCEYVPLHVPLKDVPAFMETRLGRDIAGCNVTMPDKAAVIPFLSWVQEEASLCQSVNTIAADGKKGWSTDAPGLRRALELEGGGDYQGKTLLLYGAGSAAAAIALDFARNGGKRLYLYNRTEAKAQRIAAFVRENSPLSPKVVPGGCLEAVLPACDLFFNTTPLGMAHTGAEFPSLGFLDLLPARARVVDLIYNPLETALLQRAKARGLKTQNGLSMLICQAFLSFEHWFGIRPTEADYRSLLARLTLELQQRG